MKFSPHYLTATLLFAFVFVLAPTPDLLAAPNSAFVDRDGDGFDDNAADDDADGIPDELEPHGFFSADVGLLQVSAMFASGPTPEEPIPSESQSEVFGRREFHARAICVFRSDFDAGFDSGLGLGGGLGGGGACAGGVCF